MALSQAELRSKSRRFQSTLYEQVRASRTKTRKKAFLCHSHLDEELILGLLVWLEDEDIELYIDWQDHSLPATPDKITASKLQGKILNSDLFLFLATENSKASRWCPWEIGFADASKKPIYIIPTQNHSSTYGNEYLDLYDHIEIGSNQSRQSLAVFPPSKTDGRFAKELFS